MLNHPPNGKPRKLLTDASTATDEPFLVGGNPDAEPDGFRVEMLSAPDNRKAQSLIVLWDGSEVSRDKLDIEQAWQRKALFERVRGKLGTASDGDGLEQQLDDALFEASKRWETKFSNRAALRPKVVAMDKVEIEDVQWLWPGKIARGKFNLIVGDPGQGKSFLLLDIGARVSTGAPWPDGSGNAPLGDVILMCSEDGTGDTVKPRLVSAHADCSRVIAFQGVQFTKGDKEGERLFDLGQDLAAIEAALDLYPKTAMIGIDPISAHFGDVDSHKNSEVRGLLAPLGELAARRNVAIVAVSHVRKGEGSAIHKAIGSIAVIAMARAAFVVCKDKEDPRRRLFLPIKNNIGSDHTGLAFTLAKHIGAPGLPPCLSWEAAPVEQSADEALAPPSKKGPEPKGQDEAETFLREALANGARPSKDIEAEAKEAHGISAKTLMRARNNIGVVAYRPVVPGAWWLELPKSKMAKQDGQPSIPCLLGSLGHVEIPSDQELAQQRQVGQVGQVGQEDQVVQEAQEAQV